MSKKISRTLIIGFFLCIIIISYAVDMLMLSMLGCFWLGFVVSAIIGKEQDNLAFWAASKGVPSNLMEREEKHERSERKGDGKTKQKA